MAEWRHELSVFLDKLVFVMSSAPDRFPVEDYLPPERQPTLDNSFVKLRSLFCSFVDAFGQTPETARWQGEIEKSYELYKKGDKLEGTRVLKDLYNELEYGKELGKKRPRKSGEKKSKEM